MKKTQSRFPIYKTRKQTPSNNFQSQFRNEINELISGTDYLDQFISNNKKSPYSSRNENNSKNFNSLTPEEKRKLMFQKPVTLVKRQNKYYSHQTKSPILQSALQVEKQKTAFDFEKRHQEKEIETPKKSITNNQIRAETPNKSLLMPSFDNDFYFKTPQIQKHFSSQNQSQNKSTKNKPSLCQEDNIDLDSFSFENEPEIVKTYFLNQSNSYDHESGDLDNPEEQVQHKQQQNNGFNYFQTSFNQEDQFDSEISDAPSEHNADSSSDDSSISGKDGLANEPRVSLSQNKKAIIMISSDAIEAEVNYTSDSSNDFEFQSQFFVQEKVVKLDCINNTVTHCEKFISSEAIESFSDE